MKILPSSYCTAFLTCSLQQKSVSVKPKKVPSTRIGESRPSRLYYVITSNPTMQGFRVGALCFFVNHIKPICHHLIFFFFLILESTCPLIKEQGHVDLEYIIEVRQGSPEQYSKLLWIHMWDLHCMGTNWATIFLNLMFISFLKSLRDYTL